MFRFLQAFVTFLLKKGSIFFEFRKRNRYFLIVLLRRSIFADIKKTGVPTSET